MKECFTINELRIQINYSNNNQTENSTTQVQAIDA